MAQTLTPIELADIILENTNESGWPALLEALQERIPFYYQLPLVNSHMKVHIADKLGSQDLITEFFDNNIFW